MSEFTVVEIELKEEDVLINALKQMGYKPKVHNKYIELETYYRNRTKPKAHIVINKGQIGGYGGVGFERLKKGGFRMHIDEMDKRRFKVGKLKQYYAEAKIMKVVKNKSKYSIRSRKEEDGRIKLRVRRNF